MRSNSGFSLLEILIAIAILVVGVASVVNMFPVGLHAVKRAGDFTLAGILAQEKMAEVMYLGYDNWSSIEDITHSGNVPCHSDVPHSFPETANSRDHEYKWHVNIASSSISNLAKVMVAIYWNDRGNEKHDTFTRSRENR